MYVFPLFMKFGGPPNGGGGSLGSGICHTTIGRQKGIDERQNLSPTAIIYVFECVACLYPRINCLVLSPSGTPQWSLHSLWAGRDIFYPQDSHLALGPCQHKLPRVSSVPPLPVSYISKASTTFTHSPYSHPGTKLNMAALHSQCLMN